MPWLEFVVVIFIISWLNVSISCCCVALNVFICVIFVVELLYVVLFLVLIVFELVFVSLLVVVVVNC